MTDVVAGIHVVGLGASTPIGRTALASAAAARAGISGFAEHPYMLDTAGEPMRCAFVPWLDIDLHGRERLEMLLFPAIEQTLESLQAESHRQMHVALAVGLPASKPGVATDLQDAIRASLIERFPKRFTAIALFSVGHAGPVLGMQIAQKKMLEGTLDACVVAGVESYINPDTLEWLEEQDQLHGAGPLNNAWGFIPGEAAGAALLMNAASVERLGLASYGRMLSVGTGTEPNRIKTQTVCIGEGLTAAFREGLSGLPGGAKVTDVYCDMNGEPYRADEFAFTAVRVKEQFESASDFVASADCWGDVGAASVPLGLLQATIAANKAYAKGAHAFVWASSESGERGAALLEVPKLERD